MQAMTKYLSKILTKVMARILPIIIVLLVMLVAVASNGYFANAEAISMFATLGANKTQVTPGEELQYVVTVRNDGTDDLTNVHVAQNIPSLLNYIPGSTTAEKSGTTVSVTDNWINDGVTLGRLVPNQFALLRFSTEVSSSVAVGSSIENVVQVRSDQVDWINRAMTVEVVSPNQNAVLRTGDFMKVTNNTLQNGWQDSVSVDPTQVVEFLVKVSNDGQYDARNVKISSDLPSSAASVHHPSVTLSADNANSVTDSVTVTGSSPFWFLYKIGHATLFGNTELYDCPTGCRIPESFYLSPLNLGTVHPGESASIQVTFKADIFVPTQTPTSTCTLLEANPSSGTRPLAVSFTGSGEDSDGNIQQYEFNFGDSSGGQQQVVRTSNNQISHTYNNAGTYTATLQVQDSRGNWVDGGNCSRTITVSEQQSNPTSRCLDLVASSTDGTAPFSITFTGTGEDTDGSIQEYEFNFGDTSNGQNQLTRTTSNQASHTYNNAGTFIASLLVKDSRGNWVGGNGDDCKVQLTSHNQPTVLAAETPKTLPKTGAEAALVIPTLGAAGYYLYRKFKLL